MKVLALVALLLIGSGCAANMPPNLSPQAQAAWRGTRVIHVLDVFRDAAVSANEQTPPLLSTDITRSVVRFHLAALEIVKASPGAWVQMIKLGLSDLVKRLPAHERELLAPYASLILAVLGG